MALEQRFTEILYQKYQRTQKCLLPKAKYAAIITDMHRALSGKGKKTGRQYKLLRRYEILPCDGTDKLIRKRKFPEECPVMFVTIEDTFNVIQKVHLATGHGGRDKMLKELDKKFANVSRESLELFKSFCTLCQEKPARKRMKEAVPDRPVSFNEFSSRGQMDVVDFQSMGDGIFKWIMVYQDCLTKFVILRPMTSTRASEVALQLVDIFTLLGAPVFLQSAQGPEFTTAVLRELGALWPELRILCGTLSRSERQGRADDVSSDMMDLLQAWMAQNQTSHWSLGLRFVQFMKNRAYHAAIKRSPYFAMFGVKPRVGLCSASLPDDLIDDLQTEDDLYAVVRQNNWTPTESSVPVGLPAEPDRTDASVAPHGLETDEMSDPASSPREIIP